MKLSREINDIEAELDSQITNLRIWENSFQTVLSSLLLTIDRVDGKKGRETAMDYCSRLSYIYPIVKKNAKESKIDSTTNAILSLSEGAFADLGFLNAYAHFSVLMPQLRRGIMQVTRIEGDLIEIDYTSPEIEKAELIDRLYSFISLQTIVAFKPDAEFNRFILIKATSRDLTFGGEDIWWLMQAYNHYKKYFIMFRVLPSTVFEETTGLTYDEYISFSAVVRAYADYHHYLGRAYHELAESAQKAGDKSAADGFMSEYFENLVPCFNFKIVGFFMAISGLSKETVVKALGYYLNIYSNSTNEPFEAKAYCNEGFFPPFTLIEDFFISSPHAWKYMLNLNNILYTLSKTETKFFDEKVSQHLEPTLINQLEYVFTRLPRIKTRKNINYVGGEIDLLVLSEEEKTCLAIQVKATLAPDSARTVVRVQDRAIEGVKQIERFNGLTIAEKVEVVNRSFGTTLQEITFIDMLVVRSCAGTGPLWEINDKFPIANYALIAWTVSEKLVKENKACIIARFDQDIRESQQILIDRASGEKVFEELAIGRYKIKFPDLDIDFSNIVAINFQTVARLPEFEEHHNNIEQMH